MSTEALCYLLPVDVFVPDTVDIRQRRRLVHRPPATVTSTCTVCPMRAECLFYGLETDSSGWWGGVLLHEGSPLDANGSVVLMARSGHGAGARRSDETRDAV